MPVETLITVRVTPRAARDEIVRYEAGVLHIRLRSPPVDGKANEALCRLLAERLDLPPSAVEIVAGATSRTKRVRIVGLEAAATEALLRQAM